MLAEQFAVSPSRFSQSTVRRFPPRRAQIAKLKPKTIVICGGPAALSKTVESQTKSAAGAAAIRCQGDTSVVLVSGDGDCKRMVDYLIMLGRFRAMLLPGGQKAPSPYGLGASLCQRLLWSTAGCVTD